MTDDTPLTRNLCLAVVVLTSLFVLIGADPADRLPLGAGVAYWLTHVAFGLAAAVLATRALSTWRVSWQVPAWLVVVLGGTLGAVAFTPFAMGLEALMPSVQIVDADNDWLDRLEAQGGVLAALGELLQLYPSYITAWLLVQSTPLLNLYRPRAMASQAIVFPQPPAASVDTQSPLSTDNAQQKTGLLKQLPEDIGDPIVVRSDLHYLHFIATGGEASLLGTMSALDRELKDKGLRVHRSFWVATAHVKRMVKGPYGWSCELSNGSKVPVSRRRVAEVKQHLSET